LVVAHLFVKVPRPEDS